MGNACIRYIFPVARSLSASRICRSVAGRRLSHPAGRAAGVPIDSNRRGLSCSPRARRMRRRLVRLTCMLRVGVEIQSIGTAQRYRPEGPLLPRRA